MSGAWPWTAAALSLAGMLLALPAAAGSLQISPVTVHLAPGERSSTLQLQNTGTEPIYGQVRVYAWRQQDGDDVLEPTAQLVASPPLLQLAPHATQTVRLVLSQEPPEAEQSYRLLVDELAPPGQTPRMGVDLRLRYSVPVFSAARPSQAVAADLHWSLFTQRGQLMLQVDNRGKHRAQISQLALEQHGKPLHQEPGLLGYALAGSIRRWTLPWPLPATPQGLTLRAVVNTVELGVPVKLGPAQ